MTLAPGAVIRGTARGDRRTKNLIPRLKPGEIAVIDHRDLDGLSASGLVERQPAAVVNLSPSISGRYPNRGPSILLKAGIPLIDVTDGDLMDVVGTDKPLELHPNGVQCEGRLFPGAWLNTADVEKGLEAARSFLGTEIEAFARNTLEYIERERHLVVDNLEIPDLSTTIANRHAVIVVRGEGYKQDLEAIMPYIREVGPILIAVDGGADALLEYDLKPHLIVGDMDSVSDSALRCGAEIIVHSYPGAAGKQHTSPNGLCSETPPSSPSPGSANGSAASMDEGLGPALVEVESPDAAGNCAAPRKPAPGMERLQRLGLPGKVFSVAGTSEDMAMLIAYEKGAELIVTVGTHFGLVDFLDKGRAGMASTFLVRLRVASRLVDARGVSALYQRTAGLSYVAYLFVAAAVPFAAIAALSPGLRASISLAYLVLWNWLKRHGI